MTSDEIKFMAECEHRGACGRLVTMHAISHADPFDWCMCAACPHHDGHPRDNARLECENAKLRELLSESFLLMHHGGLTTGAYGRCMELFMDAQTLGIEIPFMHEMVDE